MLNENFTKSELNKLKSVIRKELKEYEKSSKLHKLIKKIVEEELKSINKFSPKTTSTIEDIVKDVMQAYHDLLYKERNIIKNKVKTKN